MTTNQNTRQSETKRFAAITGLRTKGDNYGHAGRAALAHELFIRLEGGKVSAADRAAVIEGTGYDKGTVSRVVKVLTTSAPARKAVATLDVTTIDGSAANLAAAVKVGELFKRQPAKSSVPAERKSDQDDTLAMVGEWLREGDITKYAARAAQLADLLATIEAERAAESEVAA